MTEITKITSEEELEKETPSEENQPEDKPPFFKSWKGMYWLLMATLIFLIIIFYLFTRYFS
jgi:hypothetical protein